MPPAVKESHAGANLPWGGESAGLLTSLSVGGEMSRWKSSLLPVAFVHEANSGLLSASHVVSRFRGAHRREQQKLPRAQHQWRMDHTKKPQPMITASSPNDHGSASPPRPAKIAPSSPSCAPVAPMCPSSSQRPSPETKPSKRNPSRSSRREPSSSPYHRTHGDPGSRLRSTDGSSPAPLEPRTVSNFCPPSLHSSSKAPDTCEVDAPHNAGATPWRAQVRPMD